MAEIKDTVFFRDHFVPFAEANLSIASAPVLWGLGIYTVFSANWNANEGKLYTFRLEDHFKRLQNSARIMDFHNFLDSWNYEKFAQTMDELLRRNKVDHDALVRVIVFVDDILSGTRMRGLQHSLAAFIYEYEPYLPPAGAHLCVSSWMRMPDNAIPSRAKINGSYANSSLMKNEALANGFDDAISLDSHGHVAESTVANFFMVRSGELITPGGSTDLLEGLTRDTVFKLAENLDIPAVSRSIDRSELYLADEIFLSGSSVRIEPVLSIDKRPIGSGQIGHITQQLTAAYDSAAHASDPNFEAWLTPVH